MKKIFKKSKKFYSLGLTMPEMLVSISLFVVVITATSAAFLSSLKTQKQIIALLNAGDTASYALEVMARDIRMGKTFFSPVAESLTFLNSKNQAIVYRLNNDAVEKSVGGESFQPLTSSNIKVLDLNFLVDGEKRYDDEQARITIILKISTSYGSQEFITNLQTTVSPRDLET